MEGYLVWFFGAAVLLVMEMLSRRAYCLALSIAFLVGGLTALVEGLLGWQIFFATLACLVSCYGLRTRLGQFSASAQSVLGDWVEPSLQILEWDSDSTAQVVYRGKRCRARLGAGAPAHAEQYYVVRQESGRVLIAQERRSQPRPSFHAQTTLGAAR